MTLEHMESIVTESLLQRARDGDNQAAKVLLEHCREFSIANGIKNKQNKCPDCHLELVYVSTILTDPLSWRMKCNKCEREYTIARI